MRSYLGSIWACRHFCLCLVANDLQTRYRRSTLGVGWSLLHPLLTALVTAAVFHQIFQVPIHEFLPHVLSGLAVWAYVTGAVLQGCQCYTQAESYIRQQALPLVIYPLRTTLGALIHFTIALALAVALTWALRGPVDVLALGLVVPALGLLFLFGVALAILAGFVNVVFRDTQHILEVLFQLAFYLTPIIYPTALLAESRIGWLQRWNPLVPFLELVRRPILDGEAPSLACYGVAALITVLVSAAAAASLGRQQQRVIFHL